MQEILQSEKDILVFPRALSKDYGDIGRQALFDLNRDGDGFHLKTGNLMGFVGAHGVQLRIRSRFAQNRDDFLHYMLHVVFDLDIALFDWETTTGEAGLFDLLACLFLHQLQCAYRQGVYREFVRHEYNDAHLRGTPDIARHIQRNMPFCGNVAYSLRERDASNPLMMLVRHALEIVRARSCRVTRGEELRAAVHMVEQATPGYQRRDRMDVLRRNAHDVRHPYFTEYGLLQRIARMIVGGQRLNYGASQDHAYGVIFDGAWLWEQYLSKRVFGPLGFVHPDNVKGAKGISLFVDGTFCRYPDFMSKDAHAIMDAKYKRLDDACPDRNDFHQLITYLYITQAKTGGFVYPSHRPTACNEIGELCGYGGKLYCIGIQIPNEVDSFRAFVEIMQGIEKIARSNIRCLEPV